MEFFFFFFFFVFCFVKCSLNKGKITHHQMAETVFLLCPGSIDRDVVLYKKRASYETKAKNSLVIHKREDQKNKPKKKKRKTRETMRLYQRG